MQQDAATNTSVTNTSVMNTSVTNITVHPTFITAEVESGSLDSPVSSMNNNDDLSSVDSQTDPASTATTKASAGHTLIATMLFFHLPFFLVG